MVLVPKVTGIMVNILAAIPVHMAMVIVMHTAHTVIRTEAHMAACVAATPQCPHTPTPQ